MKLLVIPTTDWTGHPVPNRLNFVFDRIALRHHVDVCHFRLFPEELRETRCNLIPMDKGCIQDVRSYYLRRFIPHGSKINRISDDYDLILSANILPGFVAGLQSCPTVVDYMDLFSESAASYFSPPMKDIVRHTVSMICDVNLKRASCVLTTTSKFKEYLTNKISTPVEVIPNGLDTDVMHPVDPEGIRRRFGLSYPVLGYVGSLESWIDLDFVIDLFPTIIRKYPKASLIIVGPSLHTGYAEKLRSKVKRMRLEERVVFTGRIPYHELAPYISAMDVGLNPRKPWDMNRLTMGGKVLSYLACALPVLSRNMPVIEEEFGDGRGVFTYHDRHEFIMRLEEALSANVDISSVDGYDWDIIARRYEDVLKRYLK